MFEIILKIILLLSGVILAIIGWRKFFAEKKMRSKSESKYKKLYDSILIHKVDQAKNIDSVFIENKIKDLRKLGDRLSRLNIPKEEINVILGLINDFTIMRYTQLLFSNDPEKVQKAVGYFIENREFLDIDLWKLLTQDIEEKNGSEWKTVKELLSKIS